MKARLGVVGLGVAKWGAARQGTVHRTLEKRHGEAWRCQDGRGLERHGL